MFLQKQGELVTREELKRALWSTQKHVNYDANLNTTVNKLRQALGESTDKVFYIETIPRKGYRFTGTVEFSDIPFDGSKRTTSAASETFDLGREQEARGREAFRSRKSLTVIIVALLLAGLPLGATAATFWISHAASQVRLLGFGGISMRFSMEYLLTFIFAKPRPIVRPA